MKQLYSTLLFLLLSLTATAQSANDKFTVKRTNGQTTEYKLSEYDRITYKDNERDTLLINRLCGDKGTTFSIPVSHTLSEDSIFTLLKDTLGHQWFDTICIRKEDSPHFESVDCHATYFHRITEVSSTHHGIDSLSIHSREVNYDSQEHFYLYLKADR